MKTSKLLLIAMALMAWGCNDEDEMPDEGVLVRGMIELYDEFGNSIERVDSVEILITHDGGETYTTRTMLDGEYLIDVEGEWTRFWISRPSYATRLIEDRDTEYLQGRIIRLGQKSTMEVSNLSVARADCGDLPCVDLSFEVDNYIINLDVKRYFELEMSINEVIGTQRFSAPPSSEPGMTVTPLDGSSALLLIEKLSAVPLMSVAGQDIQFRVYGATPNEFHEDFITEELDNSRSEVYGEYSLQF